MKMHAILRHATAVIVLLASLWIARFEASEVPAVENFPCPADCRDIFKHLDDSGVQNTKVDVRGEVRGVGIPFSLPIFADECSLSPHEVQRSSSKSSTLALSRDVQSQRLPVRQTVPDQNIIPLS